MRLPTLPPLPSPAKINRCLHIIGKREDGYHNLQSAFQFIDWHDLMHVQASRDKDIILECTHPTLKHTPNDNLVCRAAKLLQAHTGCRLGARIQLEKTLPMGAGVGGGSSNAATTLLALNHLWSLQLDKPELMRLATQLGADVPFFIYGKNAWIEGIGDKIQPLRLDTPWFLIIKPPVHINTSEIFSNPQLTRDTQITTIANFLEQGGQNDFEALLRKQYPEIDNALIWLNKFSKATVTGSGACIFAGFETQAQAQQVCEEAPKNCTAHVTKGCQTSLLHEVLSEQGAINF